MTTPRFLQVSLLSSFAAVLLNRDDAGLAKRMRFGGAVRTRVSSQCLKRHWRLAEDAYALSNVDEHLTRSIRSREIFSRLIEPRLLQDGYDAKAVQAVLKTFMGALYGGKEASDQSSSDKHPLSRNEVIVLGEPEVEFLIAQARSVLGKDKDIDAKDAGKLVKGLLKNKDVKDNFKALANGAGIDAAMFGRFVSGDPEARISSAVHVAHALTVHAEASETDYFTAVDDLTTASEGGQRTPGRRRAYQRPVLHLRRGGRAPTGFQHHGGALRALAGE